MVAPGLRLATTSAATRALLMPTWCLRKRNWRFKLLVSIVSRSIWAHETGGGEDEGQVEGEG